MQNCDFNPRSLITWVKYVPGLMLQALLKLGLGPDMIHKSSFVLNIAAFALVAIALFNSMHTGDPSILTEDGSAILDGDTMNLGDIAEGHGELTEPSSKFLLGYNTWHWPAAIFMTSLSTIYGIAYAVQTNYLPDKDLRDVNKEIRCYTCDNGPHKSSCVSCKGKGYIRVWKNTRSTVPKDHDKVCKTFVKPVRSCDADHTLTEDEKNAILVDAVEATLNSEEEITFKSTVNVRTGYHLNKRVWSFCQVMRGLIFIISLWATIILMKYNASTPAVVTLLIAFGQGLGCFFERFSAYQPTCLSFVQEDLSDENRTSTGKFMYCVRASARMMFGFGPNGVQEVYNQNKELLREGQPQVGDQIGEKIKPWICPPEGMVKLDDFKKTPIYETYAKIKGIALPDKARSHAANEI